MAEVIDFYTPVEFRKKEQWLPVEQRGKVIEFNLQVKNLREPRALTTAGIQVASLSLCPD